MDPLRGAKTTNPQRIDEYLGYYEDKQDVRRYVGQAYDPLRIKKDMTSYKDIIQFAPDIQEEQLISENIT